MDCDYIWPFQLPQEIWIEICGVEEIEFSTAQFTNVLPVVDFHVQPFFLFEFRQGDAVEMLLSRFARGFFQKEIV